MEKNRAGAEVLKRALLASATKPPPPPGEQMEELRRGPWTVEEDLLLVQVVAEHGEGRWNALARRAGESCSVENF